MNRLMTKGAKMGDILWAMIAARRWSKDCGEPVDFACMTVCAPLLELIRRQPYIRQAYHLDSWKSGCTPESKGPNPMEPIQYDEIRHGSYQKMPEKQLAFAIAENIGVKLDESDQCPWIEFDDAQTADGPYVAYAWNELHRERTSLFTKELSQSLPGLRFVDVTLHPWRVAPRTIFHAKAFLGCRSGNFVLANAVGQKNIITFEPEEGRMNPMFGCPWGPDKNVVFWQQAYEIISQL